MRAVSAALWPRLWAPFRPAASQRGLRALRTRRLDLLHDQWRTTNHQRRFI